jgi:hypothetical protein
MFYTSGVRASDEVTLQLAVLFEAEQLVWMGV